MLTPDRADTRSLVTAVEAAVAGGAAAVQYRNKTASVALRREQAVALAALRVRTPFLFIVNDDAALAAEVGADGVHIGEADAPLAEARDIVGPDRLVGVSCYNEPERARYAVAGGADYVAFGSFHPSRVKPDARRAELSLLRDARALGVPVVAIGGIDAGNARALKVAGADAVAVITAVFAGQDPAAITEAARRIAAVFPDLPN